MPTANRSPQVAAALKTVAFEPGASSLPQTLDMDELDDRLLKYW